MKMFDMPQQGLGPLPGQQGQGQQQMGLFGGSGVGQPGGMAGMTPQQIMQVSTICGTCRAFCGNAEFSFLGIHCCCLTILHTTCAQKSCAWLKDIFAWVFWTTVHI